MSESDVDVLSSKVRRLEARVALCEDCLDIHGPPPKRAQLPEVPDYYRRLVTLGLIVVAIMTLTRIVGKDSE